MITDFDTIMNAQARDCWSDLCAESTACEADSIRGMAVEPIVHMSAVACPVQSGALGGGSFTDCGELDIPFSDTRDRIPRRLATSRAPIGNNNQPTKRQKRTMRNPATATVSATTTGLYVATVTIANGAGPIASARSIGGRPASAIRSAIADLEVDGHRTSRVRVVRADLTEDDDAPLTGRVFASAFGWAS